LRYEKRRKRYDYRKFSTYVLLITGSVGRVTEFVIVWEWEAGREAVMSKNAGVTQRLRYEWEGIEGRRKGIKALWEGRNGVWEGS